ncbi:MAG TPA: hypothetical protein VHE33_09795 [Acidobacteriaceae bacterium]|nr:hypothetical protein [Acidobacteriaceae bacterium]
MSKVRLTFVANCGSVAAGGSLVLDTSTQQFSDVSVFCTGGHHVAHKVSEAKFAPPPSQYPAGTPMLINMGDPNGVVVQLNYAIHGFTSPAIPMAGGFVQGIPFAVNNVQGATPGSGSVVVTSVP